MNILVLPRFGSMGASSRYRMYQFLPGLRNAGVEFDVHPLLSNRYLEQLYAGKKLSAALLGLAGLVRRALVLLKARRYDLVWMEKDGLPWMPAAFELGLLSGCRRLVIDLDDAQFHRYDQHERGWVRRLLGRKFSRLFQKADLVICGNRYLADQVQPHARCAPAVLPTVVDINRAVQRSEPGRGVFTIGWIGSPSTTAHLLTIKGVLKRAAAHANWKVVLIGADESLLAQPGLEYRAWSEETEAHDIAEFDVGIMPLPDEPWARGKCGLKLIQYMAAGLPVVASPVGVNRELVEQGVNGYLARGEEAWLNALVGLAVDPEARMELGAAGRRKVEEEYSLQKALPELISMLKKVTA